MKEYSTLERSARLYPTPRILLGKLIYWTEKRDGSNIGAYIKDYVLLFRSRHQAIASFDILQSIKNTGYTELLRELICDFNIMPFFELLQKGKSPTHTEFHPKDDIAIFDMWNLKSQQWLNYTQMHQFCYQYDLPIVKLYGMSRHLNMKTFEKFRLRMLKHAKKSGREGVVGKIYGLEPIFFKEKLDLPNLRKTRIHIEDGAVQLPLLPKSEIQGAVHKVYIDLGHEKFLDKRIAMPLIARYANEEATKHLCAKTKNLFEFYLEKLEDLKT